MLLSFTNNWLIDQKANRFNCLNWLIAYTVNQFKQLTS